MPNESGPPAGALASEVRVRYGDTDQMGMAHHANHLRWFEEGRTEWIRARGRSYREIEASGIRLPLVEAYVHYLAPARYDDRIRVWTWVDELGRASVRFAYRLERVGDDERLATGFTRHCFLDPAGRPVVADAELRSLLSGKTQPGLAEAPG